MKRRPIIAAFLAVLLPAAFAVPSAFAQSTSVETKRPGSWAEFGSFEYQGKDEVFSRAIADDEYRNPILAGFYPDPSIVRVGEDYYLVNSTFALYPGIPVFHSRDLKNWKQIGNVIDRPGMLDFDGMHISGDGVYAPTIEYNEGTFYVANTCVRCGGNFIVTAKDPAGPWSDPVWLPEVGGIDPSLYFEAGRVYLMNNDEPLGGSKYEGHRAIWMREIDPKTFKSISEPKMILNGGIDLEEKPIWIEGPHIYKVDGRYYLSAAEGGTERNHRQVILRSDSLFGPYVPGPSNPILTQKDLPEGRPNPITSTGHVDMFTDTLGNWWSVFLATRTYDGYHFNTGRETFLLPVIWKDGWPMILEPGNTVPYVGKLPWKAPLDAGIRAATGNLRTVDRFNGPELDNHWMFVRIPESRWWKLENGKLGILARDDRFGDSKQPSVIAQRLRHMNAYATVSVAFNPVSSRDEAGIMAFQNDAFYYAFGIGRNDDGKVVVRVRHREGVGDPARGKVIAEKEAGFPAGSRVYLRINVAGPVVSFSYSTDGKAFKKVVTGADARTLSTLKAGRFIGAMIGMYAEGGQLKERGSETRDQIAGSSERRSHHLRFSYRVRSPSILDYRFSILPVQ